MENKRKSITEIKSEFANADIHSVRHVMERYAEDDREGVKKLILSAEKKLTAHQKELDRMEHMFEYERQHADCQYICGIDEVGRGPLAGPVVAGTMIPSSSLKRSVKNYMMRL